MMITIDYYYETEKDRSTGIENYLENYHPWAYQTTHETWEDQDESGQFRYWVRFRRFSSCD